MRYLMVLSILSIGFAASVAAQPASKGFWLAREVSQGISESDFFAFARKNGFEVTTPLPDKETKSVTIDGTNYWLVFCDGSLTYASWQLPDNTSLHRSLDKWLNREGFRLNNLQVSSDYDDRSNETLTKFTLLLTKPSAPFSVSFMQYARNSQIVLEDVRYDQSFGCTLD